MAIVRIERYSRFTNVPNETIEDDRLSFRARGILVYLLSKPDHWTAKSTQLVTEGKEGRDAIRTALNELETCGYLERNRERVEHGRIVTVTVIRDLPKPGNQASVNQASGNQASTANTEQQPLSSKGRKTSSSSARRGRAVDNGPDQSSLDDINRKLRPGTEPQQETRQVSPRRKPRQEHIHQPRSNKADGLACYWATRLEEIGALPNRFEEQQIERSFRRWLEMGLTPVTARLMVDAFFADTSLAESEVPWSRFIANAERLRKRVTERLTVKERVYEQDTSQRLADWAREAMEETG